MQATTNHRRIFERRVHRPHPAAILAELRRRDRSRQWLADTAGYDRATLRRALDGDLITYGFGLAIAAALDVDVAVVMDPEPVTEL